MKICSAIALEKWTPNFSSSGQTSPTWTRSRFDGVELFNSLEWIAWAVNPVQVSLCDACGYEGCASGGYVHISYLDDLVLWTTPQIDASDESAIAQYAPAWPLKRFGALAIPKSTWDQWRSVAPLPEASSLAAPNGVAIADAWCLGPGRPTRISELVPMLRSRLLACDSLETEDAIERVERWIKRLVTSPEPWVGGAIRLPSAIGTRVETLYFDGPSDEDWPALAVQNGADYPVLDREHAFIPTSRDA
jgi:hypothetical protein